MCSSMHGKRWNTHCLKPVHAAEWLVAAGSAFSQDPAADKFWHHWYFGTRFWYRVVYRRMKHCYEKEEEEEETHFPEAALFSRKLNAGDDILMWPQET